VAAFGAEFENERTRVVRWVEKAFTEQLAKGDRQSVGTASCCNRLLLEHVLLVGDGEQLDPRRHTTNARFRSLPFGRSRDRPSPLALPAPPR
jgi:hypothetical protein